MKEKGWNPSILGWGLAGFVGAPAAAKRTDAVNFGYHLSRGSHTTESTEEEMDDKNEIKRAAAQAARGDKSVLNEMRNSGQITKKQYDRVIKKIPRFGSVVNPKYVPEINRVINILTMDNTLKVIDKMTDREKELSRRLVRRKFKNMVKRKEHTNIEEDAMRDELIKRGYDL